MFHRPTNPVSHRLARLAFFLACLAAVTVAACGPVHRYLGVDLDLALTVFRYGFYAAAAAVALALTTIVPARPRKAASRQSIPHTGSACRTISWCASAPRGRTAAGSTSAPRAGSASPISASTPAASGRLWRE